MPSLRIGTSNQVKVIASGALGGGSGGRLSLLADVDASNLQDGSILVYQASSNAFITTKTFPAAIIDGGVF
jgi:hypothetical protein|tara:strand:+ start:30265 stop:30477 length:213 start_codon:yes stop_codon:yes gene_type:complete